ncbi:hypothetical protein D3C85_1201870 [compost metagenome]
MLVGQRSRRWEVVEPSTAVEECAKEADQPPPAIATFLQRTTVIAFADQGRIH